MEKNSVFVKHSRYVSGGVTEVNSTALEWWDRNTFSTSPDDRNYVVERQFQGRLDLISDLFLGEPRYWWVIAMHNNIIDPYTEVVEGVVLYIPTPERVQSLISGKLGGVASTREVATTIFPIV